MSRKALFLLVLVALSVVPFAAVSAQEPLIESVCLVTDVGKINDATFNQFAYEGMMAAVEEFGLDTTFIETQAQTDYETNLNTCISEGYDAIVTVGFLIGDATHAAAAANPDVYFIGVDQGFAEPLPNLVGVQFREDQAGFLAGVMAGLMTESNVVAGVYGIDVPAVVKYRNGYEAGLAYVNPDAVALGVYIDSFTAPDRGAAAAEQFIGEGADVIFGAGGPTGSGAIKYAAENGALVIGVDQDEYSTTFGAGETPGAENLITSAMKRVDSGVYFSIEALVNGGEGWPTDSFLMLSAENDGVGFAPAHDADVPEEVAEAVQEALDALKDGTLDTGIDPITGALLSEMEPEATPGS